MSLARFVVPLLCVVFLDIALVVPGFAAVQDFHDWLKDLRRDAIQYGISQKLVAEALPDTLEPNAEIIRLDHKQPEGGVSFEEYKHNVVTESRLREGRRKILKYNDLLNKIGHAYGVQPQYIAALWGVETSFGKNVGGFETVPALVTLSYDVRRGAFFRQELLKALHIIDQGNIGLHEMKGSWAGAMGQCQFMPTSYEKYAQDYDKDGKRDIWHTEADVFASTAAYLSKSGWRAGEPWGVRIVLKKSFNNKLIGKDINKLAKEWVAAGVPVPNVFAADEPLSIIQSGGSGYKTYLVGNNYRILLKWNASTYFATAVGLLADQLKS